MSSNQASVVAPPGVVFTDLDGTLLDHDTYRFDEALPALEALKAGGIPLVLCSSKTRAEMLDLQSRLGIGGPFIPENGGAVLLTGGGALEEVFPERLGELPARVFGLPYPELRSALRGLRSRFGHGIRGFGDATEEEVAEWASLPLERARRAKERDFDEPFLWEPPPTPARVEGARSWLATRGMQLVRGGRFWHVVGPSDKGKAVRWLLSAYAKLWGRRPASLALGDSENDLPMLVEAEEGVLVERPDGTHLAPRPHGLRTVAGKGPVGWRGAVEAWLERLPAAPAGPKREVGHG